MSHRDPRFLAAIGTMLLIALAWCSFVTLEHLAERRRLRRMHEEEEKARPRPGGPRE